MCLCCTTVATSEIAAMEACGAFDGLRNAGCVFFIWPCYGLGETISLKVEKLAVQLKTKTIDNVFVTVQVVLNIQVKKSEPYKAFYRLTNRDRQLGAYVKDGMRAAVCAMTLDDAYSGKEEISMYLTNHLQETFGSFGYSIMSVLVTEITPDDKVMSAMNEINSSKRLKEAAVQRAEGEKIIKVKQAEAEAESMHLSGIGVARQRRAIMDGLKESIVAFNEGVSGTTSKDVMDLLILNQYFDTLDNIAEGEGVKTVFLPSEASGNSLKKDMMIADAAR